MKSVKIGIVYRPANQAFPLGLGYLSAIAQSKGAATRFFMLNDEEIDGCVDAVRAYAPNITLYSVITGEHKQYLEFNARLKSRFDFISMFGGPHVTFFPEFIENEGIDAVCIGEGEQAFDVFLDGFLEKGGLPERSPNFWIKNGNGVTKSDMLPLITDLDALPFPDRRAFYDLNPFLKDFGIKNFIVGRGCPYKCTYCFNSAYNQLYNNRNIVRRRSPEEICREILEVKSEYPLRAVYFSDDSFTVNRKWTLEFCKVYQERVGIPYGGNVRLDNIDEEVAAALAGSGCAYLHIGVESGNDHVRNTLMKRKMTVEMMVERAHLLKRRDIKLLTENIIGIPSETFEMALQTLHVNQTIRPTSPNTALFSPFPKLPLTEFAIENGYFDGNYDKLGVNFFETSELKFEEGEKEKIINLRYFFSFLSRHPAFEPFFLKYLVNRKPNAAFRLFGNLFDGYHLFKLIPFKFTIRDLMKTASHFLFSSR